MTFKLSSCINYRITIRWSSASNLINIIKAVVPLLIPLHYKERPTIPQIDKMLIQSAS